MRTATYRLQFVGGVDMDNAESILQTAMIAVEGLVGEARMRTEVSYCAKPMQSAITVDGTTPAGHAVVLAFIALITSELGADSFHVQQV